MDKARNAAVRALIELHRGGWANSAAQRAFDRAGLSSRDTAFAGALFLGSAERLVTLDALLRPLLSRPLEKLDVEVRAILESGLYQMLYMQVPARAAVDEGVKLARRLGKSSAAGLVNAVLRKAADRYLDMLEESPETDGEVEPAIFFKEPAKKQDKADRVAHHLLREVSFSDEVERACTLWSVSRPVAEAVMTSLPGEADAFFAASFSKGALPLRANTLKTTAEELKETLRNRGIPAEDGPLPASLQAVIPGGVGTEALFQGGFYHVQGFASQVAVRALSPRPGMRILDICAAPGGKSATIAQELGGGAGLVLADIGRDRLKLARTLFDRMGIEGALFFENDAMVFSPAIAEAGGEGYDAVLCDVPCSGLGVMGSKPDLRYSEGALFAGLPARQLKILETAARYLKSGGRLVYATCTVRREENGDVVRKFLKNNGEYHPVKSAFLPEGAEIIDGMMTILPHKTGMDGFFVATLERL